jgi:hypothetical protein
MREPESRYTQTEGSLDELAKGLASGTLSRRKALRMLGAALVGGALASFPGVAWAAKPAGCPSGKKCGKNCCPDTTFVCSQGKCACPTGQAACGGQCVPLTTNQNCGSCGNACSGGKTCQGGVCACPQGLTDCEGVCLDLKDRRNCGACGNVCPVGANCVDGKCICPEGTCLGNGSCYTTSCHNGAISDIECRCVCPPELPSECRALGNPNAYGCCPPGTVCSSGPGGTGIVCTPV